ncbi:MAG: radical SAM protein, partial [Candidatus Bathyarchaeia archaeon]
MKILFVYPNIRTRNGPHYQHGVGSLISVLKRAEHEVKLAYLQEFDDLKSLPELVKKFRPELACLSFGTNQWQIARLAASAIKTALNIPIICGGIHTTFLPDEVLNNPNVDMICIGEGEEALVELVNSMEKGKDTKNIKNLWIKADGKVFKNSIRMLIDDLDSLPFGDRSEFPMKAILEENGYEMSVMASRGCPFSCTYCCNHAWSKLYDGLGNYVRFRSVDNVLAEIAKLAEKYRIETLYFEDDIFTLNKKWAYEFASEYPKFFKFPFRIYVRVEAVDFELLKALKSAGLYMINIGLESGDEHIRRDVMKRNMTNKQIKQVFEWAKKLDLITRDFNIVGTPGETWKTVKKTVTLNRKVMP